MKGQFAERKAETPGPEPSEAPETPLAGDRGIPSVNRARSVQSRVSSLLALTLMCALGLGLLSWYYARALTRPHEARQAAQQAAKAHAQGEMSLPPLGRVEVPTLRVSSASPVPAATRDPGSLETFLGPAPPAPAVGAALPVTGTTSADAALQKPPGALAFERRLAGPAFARASKDDVAQAGSPPTPAGLDAAGETAHTGTGNTPLATAPDLGGLLRPTVTSAVAASVLPTRRFLLAKGAFIDCTLETAIDSTLPGMTTCITATDTFSADGSVVLLERGTKLVGETRGQVQQGTSRIFVLWTEARTPAGVVVPLSSPGTDELGRSGLNGDVNRHFWDRFGSAILLTIVSGAVQGAVNAQNTSGSVVVSPSTSTDVMTEVLRSTVSIPPTLTKAQGDRIQVLVARDVDFRSVYALHLANAPKADGAP
jgi:type IV secretion system protein VirB10